MRTESQVLEDLAREATAHQQRVERLHALRDRLDGNVIGAKSSLTMALSRYADGDDDVDVLAMATRAMAAAEAAKLIPSLIETLERQHENRSLAMQRDLQVANTATDELNHRRALVERELTQHADVSMDTLGRYLRFAATEFGEVGLNEAMAHMAGMGLETRAANCIAYLRARGEIAESTQWAA